MATENLELIDYELTATIDNQTESIPVYKIKKYQTKITNKKNIDTVLNAPINLNLILTYIKDGQLYNIEKGVVSIRLTSISGNTEYINTSIQFLDGIINTQLTNKLSLGTYLLHIEYAGSKYYESTQLTLQFSVNKRIAQCIFDQTIIEEYPETAVDIGMTLIDVRNEQKISNCLIKYIFNGNEYNTYTNENGYAILTVTMPPVEDNNCKYNMKYPLEVYTDNISYKLNKEAHIDIIAKHYNTAIIYTTEVNDYNVNIKGNVVGYKKDNSLVAVKSGEVSFDIGELEPHPLITAQVDNSGNFNINTVMKAYVNGNQEPTTPKNYSEAKETKTTLTILTEPPITRSYIKEHRIGFKAQVTHNNKEVQYGMVTFIISTNDEEVYRYITQISNNGDAYFYFDMSIIGDYKVRAEYHSMFEYQNSSSTTKTYTVMDDD